MNLRATSTYPTLVQRTASALSDACGHVLHDDDIESRGYRLFPSIGDVPPFALRRFALADGRIASVSLLGCVDSHGDEASTGLARALVTIENATIPWRTLSSALLVTDPIAYATIVNEVRDLALLDRRACPLCAAARRTR